MMEDIEGDASLGSGLVTHSLPWVLVHLWAAAIASFPLAIDMLMVQRRGGQARSS